MVLHRDEIINGKKYGAKFVGFRAFRAVVRLAGKMQKPLSPKQVSDAFDDANDPTAPEET